MDGFKEAVNFGVGQTVSDTGFHVKGASCMSWGMKDRLSRIFNPKTGRTVMLAFDHGLSWDPLPDWNVLILILFLWFNMLIA